MAAKKRSVRVRVIARGSVPYGKERARGVAFDITVPAVLNGQAAGLTLQAVNEALTKEAVSRGPIDALFINSVGLNHEVLRELRENLLATGTGPISSLGMWTDSDDGAREYSGWWVREDGPKKLAAMRQNFTEE